jgi:cell division protein FtsW
MNVFNYLKGDKVVWAIMFLLSLLSILVVYSAVVTLAHKFQQGKSEFYLIKQFVFVCIGFLVAYLVHKIRYTIFSRISQIGFLVCIPLLIYTLIKGVSAGEAARWIEIPGLKLTFQSSDLAKLVLIIYVARIIALKGKSLTTLVEVLKQLILPVAIICALILPANFSTAAILFFNCIMLMFFGGINYKILLKIMGICILSGTILLSWIWFSPGTFPSKRAFTWKARIENFVSGDTETNYQSEQANSTQRAFLPQASSDFIYAIIIEEYGLLIGFGLLFLYMILLFRGIKILRDNDKPFGGLMAIGLTFSLVFQAMVNMAVAVNLFPVTGQPLPLISMGGTSMIFTMITLGIILSVSKTKNEEVVENLEAV